MEMYISDSMLYSIDKMEMFYNFLQIFSEIFTVHQKL